MKTIKNILAAALLTLPLTVSATLEEELLEATIDYCSKVADITVMSYNYLQDEGSYTDLTTVADLVNVPESARQTLKDQALAAYMLMDGLTDAQVTKVSTVRCMRDHGRAE